MRQLNLSRRLFLYKVRCEHQIPVPSIRLSWTRHASSSGHPPLSPHPATVALGASRYDNLFWDTIFIHATQGLTKTTPQWHRTRLRSVQQAYKYGLEASSIGRTTHENIPKAFPAETVRANQEEGGREPDDTVLRMDGNNMAALR